jgi:hypothetical protein
MQYKTFGNTGLLVSGATQNPSLAFRFQDLETRWLVVAFSAGPTSPAEVGPGTAMRATLGIQNLRTRVFVVSS